MFKRSVGISPLIFKIACLLVDGADLFLKLRDFTVEAILLGLMPLDAAVVCFAARFLIADGLDPGFLAMLLRLTTSKNAGRSDPLAKTRAGATRRKLI